MELTKQVVVDKIEVLESGAVQVRTATRILENEIIVSQTFHRHVISPGNNYSSEDSRVQDICAATHTADVIASFKAATAAQGV